MNKKTALETMKKSLRANHVYRRADFLDMTSNVDRNLEALVEEGCLRKLQNGLYVCPKMTDFGEALPDEQEILSKFLNDDHFVAYGLGQFNSLGLGTTQLYNRKIVFNRKRHGEMELGGRKYFFHKWREAPKQLTKEFLLVEMVNRLDELSENKESVLLKMSEKLSQFNVLKLRHAINHYGTISTQKKLNKLLAKAA